MFSKCQKPLFKVVTLFTETKAYRFHALKMGGINSGVI